jgi:hypothetical protein
MKRIGYLTIVMAFAGGWASASAPFATRINTGLVSAFSSVGQNLFGEAVFDAATVPPNPVLPQGAVQVDVALDTQIPVAMGVFVPPNPTSPVDLCRKFVQLEVQDGHVVVAVDPDAAPQGFSAAVELKSLAAFAPRLDRCAAPPPTHDN